MDIEPPIIEKPARRQVEPPTIYRRRKSPFRSPFLWAGAVVFIVALFKGVSFIVVDEKGNLDISQERKRKMEREIESLDEAIQYALVAMEDGLYPCYNCLGSPTIDLKTGETWKYGVSIRGETGRYTSNELINSGLIFTPRFEGDIKACLAEEKRKIYFYPLLPENIKRPIPLIRPPGNKIDH